MNPAPAAAFVAAIGLLVLAGMGAWLAMRLSDWFGRSEWQELDDHERAQAALRHPSAGGE